MGRSDPRPDRNDNNVAHFRLEPNPNHAEQAALPPGKEGPERRTRKQSPSLERRPQPGGGASEVRGRKRRERERRRRATEATEADPEEGRATSAPTPEASSSSPKKVSGVVMVVNAVKALKERKGSTEQAIARYLMANYGQQFDHDEKKMEKVLCRGLKTAVNAKLLELPRRGVQRYRLGTKYGARSSTSPERAKRRGRSRTRKKPGRRRRRRKLSKPKKKKHKPKSNKKKKKPKGGKTTKHKGRRRR